MSLTSNAMMTTETETERTLNLKSSLGLCQVPAVSTPHPEHLCSMWRRCIWTSLVLRCPTCAAERRHTEGRTNCVTVDGIRETPYSQLEAEGNTQHLEPLHLKVNTDCPFVVFVKNILAKPGHRFKQKYRAKCSLLKEESYQATFNYWMLPRQTCGLLLQ